MPSPYDLRRQLWETAREASPALNENHADLDVLIDAIMADIQEFILAKLGLCR